MGSKIEWTDETWNPVTGCSKVSKGCQNCYAERLWAKVEGARYVRDWKRLKTSLPEPRRAFTDVQCHEDRLEKPLHWKKPRRVFVNSMSDLFHDAVPFDFIDRVFAVIALCPEHTFQIPTKRPERMWKYFKTWPMDDNPDRITSIASEISSTTRGKWGSGGLAGRPLPNLILMVSVENQATADERIPILLDTPAALRGVSIEPLLAGVDIVPYMGGRAFKCKCEKAWHHTESGRLFTVGDQARCISCGWLADIYPTLDWIIVGGESGPGARPMHPDWARSVRDQCQAAGVAFFFKQWGAWAPVEGEAKLVMNFPVGKHGDGFTHHWGDGEVSHRVGKKAAGRLLDGREWNEMPELFTRFA